MGIVCRGRRAGSSYSPAVDAYDPSRTPDEHGVTADSACRLGVGVVNGVLYAVGGENGSGYLTTVELRSGYKTWLAAPHVHGAYGLGVGVVNGVSTL